MRNPKTIAADLRAQAESAQRAFVPQDLRQAIATLSEFADSVAATLDAAGLIDDEEAAAPGAGGTDPTPGG